MRTAPAPRIDEQPHEPPRIERVLSPADLEREFQYAGPVDASTDARE